MVKRIKEVSYLYMYLKKHNCPKCGSKLKVAYRTKCVSPYSPEAKALKYLNDEDFNVNLDKLEEGYFKCVKCNQSVGFLEMKKIEKHRH